EPLREVERRRAAGVVAQQPLEVVFEPGIVARRKPLVLQLVERRDQRLRHVAAAVVAEATGERLGFPQAATAACSAARKKAVTLAGSLTPGDASVPLALSTANGCVARIRSEEHTSELQ